MPLHPLRRLPGGFRNSTDFTDRSLGHVDQVRLDPLNLWPRALLREVADPVSDQSATVRRPEGFAVSSRLVGHLTIRGDGEQLVDAPAPADEQLDGADAQHVLGCFELPGELREGIERRLARHLRGTALVDGFANPGMAWHDPLKRVLEVDADSGDAMLVHLPGDVDEVHTYSVAAACGFTRAAQVRGFVEMDREQQTRIVTKTLRGIVEVSRSPDHHAM